MNERIISERKGAPEIKSTEGECAQQLTATW
jgi:hypothetical protein